MAAFLEKSDTFTDWMEKINKFHEEIQNGFGIPSQENKYDTTDGKYLQVGAFGLGKIETTTTDTLDVVGTRFDFVSADATSNFSMPRNFLGGSLVTIVNNGQGFQIIQNDDFKDFIDHVEKILNITDERYYNLSIQEFDKFSDKCFDRNSDEFEEYCKQKNIPLKDEKVIDI